MRWFAAAIALGAFLLFQVQPLMGKLLLPWFGGTPAVWTTCLVFFQLLLLLGYLYAHALQLPALLNHSPLWHRILVIGSMMVLVAQAHWWGRPLLPDQSWRPAPGGDTPLLQLLLLLLVAVGVPFILLSTTGPLIQRWFSLRWPEQSPYRLYALSNLGSLLGLLSYPFVIEPWLDLNEQVQLWLVLFLVYSLALWQCMGLSRKSCEEVDGAGEAQPAPDDPPVEAVDQEVERWAAGRLPPGQIMLWLALSTTSSALLMAITNQLCQEVAAVPLLWVVPLSLYLITFILCFEGRGRYLRDVYLLLLILAIPLGCTLLFRGLQVDLLMQIMGYNLVLFLGCMVCHGELALLKPIPTQLTGYYLSLAAGGALGGLFVAVVSPMVFSQYAELHLSLWVLAALTAWRARQRASRGLTLHPKLASLGLVAVGLSLYALAMANVVPSLRSTAAIGLPVLVGLLVMKRRSRRRAALTGQVKEVDRAFLTREELAITPQLPMYLQGSMVFALLSLATVLTIQLRLTDSLSLDLSRNFYGALQVREELLGHEGIRSRTLYHGRTNHGFQLIGSGLDEKVVSYYTAHSGIGRLLSSPALRDPQFPALRVGVIGLGVGTLAAYGEPGDLFRFYEINPRVISLALGEGGYFSFLTRSRAAIDVVPGDARRALEDAVAVGARQRLDLLVLDAFTSDAIPVHLLTSEAVALYLEHLREPESVLAIHISNRYLDLVPVVQGLARHFGLTMVVVDVEPDNFLARGSTWVLLSLLPTRLQIPSLMRPDCHWFEPGDHLWDPVPLWTDRYSNLVRILKP